MAKIVAGFIVNQYGRQTIQRNGSRLDSISPAIWDHARLH